MVSYLWEEGASLIGVRYIKAGILGGGENWNGDAVNIPFKKRLKNQSKMCWYLTLATFANMLKSTYGWL